MYTFKELTLAEWDAFEQKHPQGSMTQSADHVKLLQSRQRNVVVLGLVDANENIVAGSLVSWSAVHGGNMYVLEHGPLLDYGQLDLLATYLTHLKAYAKANNGLFIRFSPNVVYRTVDNAGDQIGAPADALLHGIEKLGAEHLPFKDGMVTAGALRWQYVKDLAGLDVETLPQTYGKDIKYYLKKTAQFGVAIRELTRDELPAFKQLTADTAARIGFPDKELDFYEKLYDTYGDKAHYMVAEINFAAYIAEERAAIAKLDEKLERLTERLAQKETKKNRGQFNEFTDQKQHHLSRIEKTEALMASEGADETQIVAGALFVEQPQEMIYLFSGTYEQYKEFYGPYALQDAMLHRAVEAGLPKYNFLGIAGDFSGKDGVFKFKANFNGVAEQMIGEFDVPVRPMKFKAYKLLKRLMGREI